MQQKILNNRYELERRIGEGGMARVYRGHDLRLNRLIAVKVLHSHFASDPSFLLRFQHEAQAAANLRHPNIVDVYDVGQDGDIQYIVMEYVEGSDLKSLILNRGSLPVEQAVSIAEAVAEALDAAHQAGLIHRDVKPQNIIVGDNGRVKITDFGIAKSKSSTAMTETGVTFGTADYISPEQARGQPATPSSDIYALGVTLYEMLTGRLPFTGDNSIAVAMQHVSAEPPPLRMYNPRIPPQLESLVLRALSKNPDDRPATAYEFARDLHSYRTIGEQETTFRPAVARPAAPRPAPRVSSSTTASRRTTLPPPRPVITAPPPSEGRGLGFGGFLLGLLLLGGVLGLVYLFAIGTFNDLFSLAAATGNQPRPLSAVAVAVTPTASATAVPTEPTVTPTVTPTPVPQITVPNLINLDEQQAVEALESLKLVPKKNAPRYSDTVKEGAVLYQDPVAGKVVTQTSTITYSLSLGPGIVNVPDVQQMRSADAQGVLKNAGFQSQVQEVNSDTVAKGIVISQDPPPNTRVPLGGSITLVVSKGNDVTMPDVTGLTEDAAKQKISAAGLVWSYSDYQSCAKLGDLCSKFGPGIVVSSVPRGGDTVPRGTGVTLGVRAPK